MFPCEYLTFAFIGTACIYLTLFKFGMVVNKFLIS